MKKIVLTMVALMAFMFSFAETNNNSADERFNISYDMRRLSVLLDLNEWQAEAVEVIQWLQQRNTVVIDNERPPTETACTPCSKKRCHTDEARTQRQTVRHLHAFADNDTSQQTSIRRFTSLQVA